MDERLMGHCPAMERVRVLAGAGSGDGEGQGSPRGGNNRHQTAAAGPMRRPVPATLWGLWRILQRGAGAVSGLLPQLCVVPLNRHSAPGLRLKGALPP